MHGRKGKFEEKNQTLNLWVEEGKDSNRCIKFFSLKVFSKRKVKALNRSSNTWNQQIPIFFFLQGTILQLCGAQSHI
jgi:hypothetical protein